MALDSAEGPEPAEQVAQDRTPFERVYRGVLRSLYEGRIVPGQRLVEPDLMQQFKVGRGTVREALNRLASAGIVEIVRYRGALVRRLSRQDVSDVLDLVELMLGLAARRGAEKASAGVDASALVAAHDHLQRCGQVDDFSAFLKAREDYYRALVRLAGNKELARTFPDAQVHIMRLQLRNFGRAAEGMELLDYARLTLAILSGDAAAAETAGREHVRGVSNRVAALPDEAFPP